MTKEEARAFLALHRSGETPEDSRLAKARSEAEQDAELHAWWQTEQELDRAIAQKLAAVTVPAGATTPRSKTRPFPVQSWRRPILLAAAAIVALAVLFGSWRGPFQPAASLAEYRDEMISFVKIPPSLELESAELNRITDFLAQAGAPAQFALPPGLQKLGPVGCRVLRFRERDVTLICFQRGGGRLAHLLVIDRKALREMRTPARPQYAAAGDWMTAAWTDGPQVYLLAAQGDQRALEALLPPDH